MRKLLSLALILTFFSRISVADEGMWLPLLIKQQVHSKMQGLGLKLSAEDIYDINKSSLKDAIGGFGSSDQPLGFFCSSEIISPDGLLLTNHHCGFDAIQQHSSIDHDYLTNGFWAKSKSEELANEGMTISFLVRMEDVSDRVLAALNDTMTENRRNAKIKEISKEIEKEAKGDSHYNTSVETMLNNNKFYLLVYETFEDVRLVGAPPSAIGKFGGDTDNWMWPRHTGDFSMFRVYTGPDGKPAKYSKDNIPMKAKHYLPVSIKGVKEGDYSMVMGFPGTTDRYLSSYGVKEAVEILNPAAIKIRTKKLDIIKEDMASSDKIRIQYASKYAQSSNYWKYFIGQNRGLKRLNIYDRKKDLETKLQAWIDADETRKQKYGEAISLIDKAYQVNEKVAIAQQYINEAMFQGAEIAFLPYEIYPLYDALSSIKMKKDESELKQAQEQLIAAKEELKTKLAEYFKNYNITTDKKLFSAMFKMYFENVPEAFHFPMFTEVEKKYKGDFDKYTEDLFAKSMFASEEKMNKFLENDQAFAITNQILMMYFTIENAINEANEKLEKGKRLFVAALMEMEKDREFYPDANSTLRVSYGTVGTYVPRDAVDFKFYTTIDGIMEKEDSTDEEFIVPAKLKELYKAKDYGQYGENGTLNVCFISNNDITGGNSGSPVINGNGELIGTAFDGNWEAMSGDIAYEPNAQRTIICDIRYVLFIIDKFAGAKYLIDEMTLVK